MRAEDYRPAQSDPVDRETLASAQSIVDQVRDGGREGLQEAIRRFEGRDGGPLIVERAELEAAYLRLAPETQALLTRTRDRIQRFAEAQLSCLQALDIAIPGGRAGHTLSAVKRAGCYAPGGTFPLPSSVLMTALTAKVAGVESVVVATPSRDDLMLGAAWLSGADELLWAGGAQAVAALAYGVEGLAPVDIIVGPGNRWVTAAKALVVGRVGIDMLAGPSELVVVADEGANPETVAADLLGQAEHDTDAIPVLVTTSEPLARAVRAACERQVEVLPTGDIAREALKNGAALLCDDRQEMLAVVDRLAPEHLELQCEAPKRFLSEVQHYGGAFVGQEAAEVFGDYGAGPNHVLPTGGTARYTGGLSVMTFIRVRTWMTLSDLDASEGLREDTIALATCEGLSGHARSARARLSGRP